VPTCHEATPFQWDIETRIVTVKVEEFVTTRAEQFAGSQHGDQLELGREPRLAIPGQGERRARIRGHGTLKSFALWLIRMSH
jgi:hypothetical protein